MFSSSDSSQTAEVMVDSAKDSLAKELGTLVCSLLSENKSVNCLEGFWQFNKENK